MEENTNATVDVQETVDAPEAETPEVDNQPSIEELQARLSAVKAQNAKQKAAIDKLTKEAAENKRQLREKMTEQEQAAAIKEEEEAARQEYVKDLEDYKRRNEAKERYMMQGLDAELARQAADAEVMGDMDALADIQRQHTDNLIRAKEAEWKSSRPRINVGNGEYSSMTKEEIMAIPDRVERRKAIAMNQEAFQ